MINPRGSAAGGEAGKVIAPDAFKLADGTVYDLNQVTGAYTERLEEEMPYCSLGFPQPHWREEDHFPAHPDSPGSVTSDLGSSGARRESSGDFRHTRYGTAAGRQWREEPGNGYEVRITDDLVHGRPHIVTDSGDFYDATGRSHEHNRSGDPESLPIEGKPRKYDVASGAEGVEAVPVIEVFYYPGDRGTRIADMLRRMQERRAADQPDG